MEDKEAKKRFELSAKMIVNLKTKPTDSEKLELYGLYKQSTVGDCNISEPFRVLVVEHAKWDAWNSNKGTNKIKAMNKYSDLTMKLINKYGINK